MGDAARGKRWVICPPYIQIRTYLDTVRRVGALGHTADDETYREFQEKGVIDEDPVAWARDILLIERATKLLL